MSEAWERERQNNARLDDLAGKVSAIRDFTVNIYDRASDTRTLDDNNETFANMSNSVKNTANRLTRMAKNTSNIQIFRLAGDYYWSGGSAVDDLGVVILNGMVLGGVAVARRGFVIDVKGYLGIDIWGDLKRGGLWDSSGGPG
ncbi:hypothetical protein TWF281_010114 [Arthrobotrys megalospora]